jgi:hypothetical protein
MAYTASAPVNTLVKNATSSTEPMAGVAPADHGYLMTGFY